MPKQSFATKKIVHTLRETSVLIAQGGTVPEACKLIEVSDTASFHWRRRHRR